MHCPISVAEELELCGYVTVPQTEEGTTVAELIDLLQQFPPNLVVCGTSAMSVSHHYASLKSLAPAREPMNAGDYGVDGRDVLQIGF